MANTAKIVYVIDVDIPDETTYDDVVRIHNAVQDLIRNIKFKNQVSIHVKDSADKVLKAATR